MSDLEESEKYKIPDECKQDIAKIFDRYDEDKNGIIDPEELEKCLQVIGFCPTSEDITFLLNYLDKDEDGKLQISELKDNIDVIYAHSVCGKEMMEAFQRFDMNGDKHIGKAELVAILTTPCGENPLPMREARELVDELAEKYDTNKDGKFSYPEFVQILISNALPGQES